MNEERIFGRRVLLPLGIAAGLWAVSGRFVGSTSSGEQPSPASGLVSTVRLPRPNIVFVLVDDFDVGGLSPLGGLKSLLVDEGTTFTNHFAPNALCSPSRASILRGQYSHNTGVMNNGGSSGGGYDDFHGRGLEASTVATWLKGKGYSTALMGKYLNGYGADGRGEYVPPGWDEWDGAFDGIYNYYDYEMNENGRVVQHGHDPADYLTDLVAAKAVEYIHSASAPFFLYVAPVAPHGKAVPPVRY